PNPVSWLMFAYGSALFVTIEHVIGASWHALVLPAVCALSSLVVAGLCFRRRGFRWPDSPIENAAFLADLGITLAYGGVLLAQQAGLVASTVTEEAGRIALSGAILTSVTAFVPLLRSTFRRPSAERAMPWVMWTLSYGLLFVATVLVIDLEAQGLQLLVYPLANIVLHGAVVALVLTGRRPMAIARIVVFPDRRAGPAQSGGRVTVRA
ncbi:MAG: hypothetical protein PHS60_16065, partial [Zavarzinia sp.]|nr:hypothetical protein [Zavarzinia sp.]